MSVIAAEVNRATLSKASTDLSWRLRNAVLSLDAYQEAAALTDQNHGVGVQGLTFPLLGLFGEVGTLLSALKKKRREGDAYCGYSEAVVEEFGDVLWYFSSISSRASVRLSEVASRAALVCQPCSECVTFLSLQARKDSHGSPTSAEFEEALIALAGKTGLLLNEFSESRKATESKFLLEHLQAILSVLVRAADVANINLQGAAVANLVKINSRWPSRREFTSLFDTDYASAEQLPRHIEMEIIETSHAGKTYVIQLCNGIEIGSPLTDNKILEDDYRFHDVFHLSYAAILGWSPCLRALLKFKRKSQPNVDENEDGARAALTEEGVSTFIFQHALHLNYFADIEALDYSLLKSVRDFVHGYEVDRCPLWQWEKAILDGFEIFRDLRRYRRGIVRADLVSRSVTFQRHPNDR
jgi:NTP pyrophosphatase (non-canonical NTP hydrolase)